MFVWEILSQLPTWRRHDLSTSIPVNGLNSKRRLQANFPNLVIEISAAKSKILVSCNDEFFSIFSKDEVHLWEHNLYRFSNPDFNALNEATVGCGKVTPKEARTQRFRDLFLVTQICLVDIKTPTALN